MDNERNLNGLPVDDENFAKQNETENKNAQNPDEETAKTKVTDSTADAPMGNAVYTDEQNFTQPSAFATEYGADDSYAPPRETVYTDSVGDNRGKPPKKRRGIGMSAVLVAACVLLSGGAAFAGTYIANSISGNGQMTVGEDGKPVSVTPSVLLQSYTNPAVTPGSFEDVAEVVSPTVVEITTESIVTDSVFWGGNYVTSGAGSGVIISADGLIVTNNHVVSGANTITVTTTNGTEYKAEVIGSDSDSDIAVIKVDGENLPFALMGDSDKLVVGQSVVAVGNPLGELGGTVTNGIVSALSRDVSIDGTEMTLIQTNAAVNPGNSGGGLFNMYGELIGVVNAKSTSTASGTSVEGIGFAIPVNTAAKVTEELINYGYVRGKVMLGITYVDVDSSYKAMYYRVNALGVYVATSESEALEAGDRIVAIDGDEVTYGADVKAGLRGHSVGDEISVTVVRGGKYVDVKIVLKEYIPTDAGEPEEDPAEFENNFGGIW